MVMTVEASKAVAWSTAVGESGGSEVKVDKSTSETRPPFGAFHWTP